MLQSADQLVQFRHDRLHVGLRGWIRNGERQRRERVDVHGGRVKIGGEIWSARALDGDQVLEPGMNVQVAEIQGATALVYL